MVTAELTQRGKSLRVTARLLLVVYAVLLYLITLTPGGGHPGSSILQFILDSLASWGLHVNFYTLEFAANIALFVPLGLLVPFAHGSPQSWVSRATVVLGAVVTLMIEYAQLFIPNRFSDPRDLLANTLGTALGVLLAAGAQKLLHHRQTRTQGVTLSNLSNRHTEVNSG